MSDCGVRPEKKSHTIDFGRALLWRHGGIFVEKNVVGTQKKEDISDTYELAITALKRYIEHTTN